MLPRVNPTQTTAWKALEAHAAATADRHLQATDFSKASTSFVNQRVIVGYDSAVRRDHEINVRVADGRLGLVFWNAGCERSLDDEMLRRQTWRDDL